MTIAAAQLAVETMKECPFVEVLTAEVSGAEIGFRFGGNYPGPNALIAGDVALIDALSDRLLALPTLPWMWGKLYLVEIDGIARLDIRDAQSGLAHVMFDEVILLPHAKTFADWQGTVNQAYWTTLKLCRRLGMIEGRGVTR